MATEKLSIEVVAELSALKRSLQEAGGLTEKQAQGMVIGLEKRIGAATKAAKALEKANQTAAKKTGEFKQQLASVAKLASSAGGSLGALGSVANSTGSAIAELAGASGLGGMAVAGGVAVAAAAAVAYGMYELAGAADAYVQSAEPALDHLRAMGAAGGIPQSAIDSINSYTDTSSALSTETARLHVETAGFVAELLGPAKLGITGAASALDTLIAGEVNARNRAIEATTGFHDLGSMLIWLAEHGPLGYFVRLGESAADADVEAKKLSNDLDHIQALAEAEDDRKRAAAARADADIKAHKAEQKAAAAKAIADDKAEEDALRGIHDGIVDLRDMSKGYYADTLTPQQQLIAEHDAEIKAINDKTHALTEQIAAVKGLDDATKVSKANSVQKAEADAKAAADAELARKQLQAGQDARNAKEAQDADSMFQANLARSQADIDQAIAHGDAIIKAQQDTVAVAGIVADALGSSADSLGQFMREGSAGAKAMLITSAIAGEGSAVIAYEVAKAQALAQLGPVAGAVAVAAITAAEVISVATIAAQVAGIATAHGGSSGGSGNNRAPHIPAHPLGGPVGIPDHVYAINPSTEYVANSRGTHNLGGPQAIDDANRGLPMQPIILEQRYGPMVDRVMVDKLRKPGRLRDSISHIAGQTGHVAGH